MPQGSIKAVGGQSWRLCTLKEFHQEAFFEQKWWYSGNMMGYKRVQ
jgi:hypothetical protein